MFDVFTLMLLYLTLRKNNGILEILKFNILTVNNLSDIHAHIPIIDQNCIIRLNYNQEEVLNEVPFGSRKRQLLLLN